MFSKVGFAILISGLVLTLAIGALAGQPHHLIQELASPSKKSGEGIELHSTESRTSLPGQLYKALTLVESDFLLKKDGRISLKDPHSEFQLNCQANRDFSCTFLAAESELGWTVSETSAQAILYRALEALSKDGKQGTVGVKRDDDETIVRLGDNSTSSSMSCMKRKEESIQFNCRFRLRPTGV